MQSWRERLPLREAERRPGSLQTGSFGVVSFYHVAWEKQGHRETAMKPTDLEDLGVERWVSEGGSGSPVGVTRARPPAARDPQYSTSGETDVPCASHRVGSVAGSPIGDARGDRAGSFDECQDHGAHGRARTNGAGGRRATVAAVRQRLSSRAPLQRGSGVVRESRCAGGCVDAGDLVPRRMGKYPSRPAPRPHALRK